MSLPFMMGTARTFLVWYSVSSSTKSLKWGLWWRENRQLIAVNCLLFAPAPSSRNNFDEHTNSIHKPCKQKLSIIRKLNALSAALQLLLLLCGRGHQLCSARGETEEERLINCQEGTKLCREQPSSDRVLTWVRQRVCVVMSCEVFVQILFFRMETRKKKIK